MKVGPDGEGRSHITDVRIDAGEITGSPFVLARLRGESLLTPTRRKPGGSGGMQAGAGLWAIDELLDD
jgi:hypothetical protein